MEPKAELYRQECLRLINSLLQEMKLDCADLHTALRGTPADEYRAASGKAQESLMQLKREIVRR